MESDNLINAFFALVKAGLWEKDIQLSLYGKIDFSEILRFAEEQSVLGLVTAGLQHIQDISIPQVDRLLFIGKTMQIEQRNKEMNLFIGDIVGKMREVGINTVLLKGQGIAQSYERPMWRTSGDVDFFLSEDNYLRAKKLLVPLSSSPVKESEYVRHIPITISSWTIQLHGNLRCALSKKIDKGLDEIGQEIFSCNQFCMWMNNNTQVVMPDADNNAIYIFTHILKHFYKGGIGLRQLCDWCRLLWSYRNEIDVAKLEKRLRKMRLVTEWKTFGAFAVERLGMPVKAMPLYDPSGKWKRKAQRIEDFIMMSGNFGHNRDSSYFNKYPYIIWKAFSMKRRVGDLIMHARLFPLDSLRFAPLIMGHGLFSATRGV